MKTPILWTYYKREDGLLQIKIRISEPGKPASYIPTGHYILQKEWNVKTGRVRKVNLNYNTINQDIEALLLNQREEKKIIVTDFITYSYAYIERYNNSESLATHANYRNTLNLFRGSGIVTDYSFDKLSDMHTHAFNNQLMIDGYKDSTRKKFLMHLSCIYDHARLQLGDQVPFTNPFAITINVKQGVVETLTVDELDTFRCVALNKKLELFRDMYLMAYCNAGIRVSDLVTIPTSGFFREQVKVYLKYVTRKNGKLMWLEQSEEGREIGLKYFKADRLYLFPLLKENDERSIYLQIKHATVLINRALKKIAAICGIKKNIHIHTARHTFANLANEMTSDVRMIQEALGHSNFKSTEVYLKTMHVSQSHLTMLR